MHFGPPVPLQSMTLKGAGTSGGALTPPSAPFTLAVDAALASTTAELTWTATNKTSSSGFGYQVQRNIDNAGWVEIDTTTGLSYDDSVPGAAGETYNYRIVAYNSAGEGVVSNEASVILPGEGEAPILSGPSQVFAEPFTLSWTAVPGATSYDLERSTDNITFGLLVNTALLSYETNESSQGFYYFRVKPLAGVVEGITSNTVTVEYIVPLPWILEDGTWNDGGEWKDTSNWND